MSISLIVLIILILVGALPTWGQSRSWDMVEVAAWV